MWGSRRRVVAVGLVSLAVVASLASTPTGRAAAVVRSAKTSTTQTLAPGLTLTRISDPAGPWIVRVLSLDPTQPITVDIATAGGPIGTYAKTSAIGSAHDALAAINGDFTIAPGRPLHPFSEDGALKQIGTQTGTSFAISQDEQHRYVGSKAVTVKGRNLTTRRAFPVSDWNSGPPHGGEVVVHSPYGGSARVPPSDACSARLKPSGKMRFGGDGVGVSRDYRVVRRRCAPAPMSMRPSTVVVSSNRQGKGAAAIREMKKRHSVRLSWSIGWAGVMDSVGGMPQLVRGGKNIAHTCGSYFCSRNPRTAIGVTASGTILLVTVDGRKSSSIGMTLIGLADYLRDLGAVRALNLDGGGGSTMWVRGQGVVNDPSDRNGERPVTNALLVLPGPDAAEPILTPPGLFAGGAPGVSPIEGISRPEARHTMARILSDPGSTGGLLEALETLGRRP